VKRAVPFESGLYSAKTAAYIKSTNGIDWIAIDKKARGFIKSRSIAAGVPEANVVEEDFRACLMSDDEGTYRPAYLEQTSLIRPTDGAE
jgi:hypothetical protein